MTSIAQNKEYLFGVVYNDDSFGDEAKKMNSFVHFLVTTVERVLMAVGTAEQRWRGYYIATEAFPGKNKFSQLLRMREECQYIIYIINKTFTHKDLHRVLIKDHYRFEKGSRLINVFYGMSQEEADELQSRHDLLKPTESILIPEQYENNPIQWISQIIQSLTSK